MTRHDQFSGWRRLYRAALYTLPTAMRGKHGDAMEALFVRELARAKGVWGRVATAFPAVLDVLRRAPYEWVATQHHVAPSSQGEIEIPQSHASVTVSGVLRLMSTSFVVAYALLTGLMVLRYVSRRPFELTATVPEVVFSVPFTSALTVPAALCFSALWLGRRLRRESDGARMPLRLRRAVLCVSAAVAACTFVLVSEVVPRSNTRLMQVLGMSNAPTSDRTMSLGQLRNASREAAARQRQSASPAEARHALDEQVGYDVEIQKKFVLTASCIVLALSGLAFGWHFARAHTAVLLLSGFAICTVCVVGLMAGEALAEETRTSPPWSMWATTELLILATLPALRARRRPASRSGALLR